MKSTKNTDAEKISVEKLLVRCGISPKLQGFDFLAKAVSIYSIGRDRKISDVCSEIGESIGYSEHKVHNYADYALGSSPTVCAFINETLGTDYLPYQLQNKRAVALLAICHNALNNRR